MPATFTIDFQERTRAAIAYESVPPRSSDLWTEMLCHLAFCVGRTFANLDRDDQREIARQFEAWLDNAFADFPVHVGSPAMLVPCARFVSAYDGDASSYVRGAYGFGLNARGLDYYGPMATAVLLRHVQGGWDRAEDLLRPVRVLCKRVLAKEVDEAGHVMLVADCMAEALKDMRRPVVPAALSSRPPVVLVPTPVRTTAGRKATRAVFVGTGMAVLIVLGIVWHLNTAPPAVTVLAPIQRAPREAPPQPAKPPEEKHAEIASPQVNVPVPSKAAPPVDTRVVVPAPIQPPAQSPAPAITVPKPTQEARAPQPSPPTILERTIMGRDGVPMVLVPAGEFLMGSDRAGENPPHRVHLEAFYIDRYEVTNARYLKFVEAARHRAPLHSVDPQYDLWVGRTLAPGVADLPVVNVDWYDADAYCRWAGKRLPTEAEWEKAARGTDGRLYPWGNETPSLARLNFSRRWQGPHTLQPVGSYESGGSPYGARDMAGNVWEWANDWYDAGYYRAAPERNPPGPADGTMKVLRGGSWTNSADTVRVSRRREEEPEIRDSDIGFRCAYIAPAR